MKTVTVQSHSGAIMTVKGEESRAKNSPNAKHTPTSSSHFGTNPKGSFKTKKNF